jgi:hypothetical protein
MTNDEMFMELMKKVQEHSKLHIEQASISDGNTQMILMKHNEMANMTHEVRAIKTELKEIIEVFKGEMEHEISEIKKHSTLSDGEAEEMHYQTGEKAKYFLRIESPGLTFDSDKIEYLKKLNKIKRGLWSIIKFAANGNRSGSYKRIINVMYQPTINFIQNLNFQDYKLYRTGKPILTKINREFRFEETTNTTHLKLVK